MPADEARIEAPKTGHKAASTSGSNGPAGPPQTVCGGLKKVYKIRGTSFVVDRRYDIIKAIGLGAYGLVCSAHDEVTGDYVAVKRIPKLFHDLIDTRRVLREIYCMRLFGQRLPHLLPLLDVMSPVLAEDATDVQIDKERRSFTDVYLVSPLADTDLHSLLKSRTKITFEHHTYMAYQLFKAVAYLHSAGIMHRDIKPGNIFIGDRCETTLGDFGLSRGGIDLVSEELGDADPGIVPVQVADLTDYVITRWYRSPELLLMNPYTHAVDMWSLGCVFVEMMLRKPLFQGRNYMHQFEVISEVVDFPTDPEAVQAILPHARPEQCRATAKLGKALKDREVQDLGPEKAAAMDARTRLFRKFGLDPEACSRTWNRYMDLVSACLDFEPAKRLTARGALLHPYVQHLAKNDSLSATVFAKGDGSLREYVLDRLATSDLTSYWDFDKKDLTEEHLRDCFWKQMNAHPGDFAQAALRDAD